MRVLISGGGTGGHIYPALAIADKIRKECPCSVIEYVGTSKGLESTLVPKAGYKIHYIKVRGFKRKLTLDNVDAAIKAVTSVIEAKKIIKEFRPDIVVGTGGYVCWPVLKAAASMSVPTIVHESNAYPGITTKMLSKYVTKILLGFEKAKEYLDCDKQKAVFVGSPVSEKMLAADKQSSREKIGISKDEKMIVSAGGSLGARHLNENVYELIRDYSLPKGITHIHATGAAGWNVQSELYKKLGFEDVGNDTLKCGRVTVCKYIYNMHEVLPASDVYICRGGAMTMNEIAILAKAAVIVPSPYVAENHQYKNAKVLTDANAAQMIEEKDLNGEILIQKVKGYIENDEQRRLAENNVRQFAEPYSLEKIFEIIKKEVKQ